MAGRGRGSVLPAWMTEEAGAAAQPSHVVEQPEVHRREDQFQNVAALPPTERAPPPLARDTATRHRDRSPSNGRDARNDRHRPDRSRSRSPEQKRRTKDWRSSKRGPRKKNFDVMPDGAVAGSGIAPGMMANPMPPHQPPPPPMPAPMHGAGSGGTGLSFSLPTLPAGNPTGAAAAYGGYNPSAPALPAAPATGDMQLTKHARRLYVGGIPPGATDNDIKTFFSEVVTRCAPDVYTRNTPNVVLAVYLNVEKCFAFVEFNAIELTTACLALDGVNYTGARTSAGIPANSGGPPCVLRIRRPNDYRAELVPPANRNSQPLDLTAIGVIATSVPDGPNKIFIGGLPTSLNEDQVKELLSTFGPLRAFHLVRDAGNPLTKGYGFCEYVDSSLTPIAIAGLNGLQVMDKTITVKASNAAIAAGAAPTPSANLATFVGAGATQPPPPAAPPSVPPAMEIGMRQPTKVLKLKNMVSADELQDDGEHADIIDDVRTECAQYGGPAAVTGVLIPRVKEGYPVRTEGSVFVSFTDTSVARTAAMALSGRKFGNNVVAVEYYDETNFQRGMLDA